MKPKTTTREVEKFFDVWNPSMAYVLGYFAADGCMYVNKNNGKYVSFTSSDLTLIQIVKSLTQASNAIEIYQPKGNSKLRYTIQLSGHYLFSKLLELGFTPRKSLTLKFPTTLPEELLSPFVRGYFDGDGNAYFDILKRKQRAGYIKYFMINIRSGSKIFLETLRKKLIKIEGVGEGSLYYHSGAFSLAYSGRSVVKLCRFMYPSEDIPYLERKFRILQKGCVEMGP